MSQQDFVPVNINLDTLQNNPAMLQVRTAGNFLPEEQAYWDAMAKITNLNTILTNHPDPDMARDNFFRLDPELQRALTQLNPEAEYSKAKESFIKKYLVPSWAKSPLRFLEKGAMGYIGLVENLVLGKANLDKKINTLATDLVTGKSRQALEKASSSTFWKDGWFGYNQWDRDGVEKLDTEYNKAIGALARGTIDKKSILETIREYGVIDNDMADAVNMYVNNPTQFGSIVERYNRKKINIGSRIVDWAGKFAPVKENPTGIDTVKEVLAASILSIGGMRNVSRNEYGEFVTEKLFKPDQYGDPGPGLDIAATFFADPLTYVTFGGSRAIALSKSARIAEELRSITDGALKIAKVEELFRDPQFVQKHTSFVEDVNQYRAALDSNDAMAAGRARVKISMDHPEYDNDILLGLLVKSTVKKDGEEVLVTDMDTLFRFFESGENMNYLINGLVNNTITFRENSVALQNRQRRITNGLRSYTAKIFQGLDRDVIIGAKPMPGEFVATWSDIEKAVLARPQVVDATTPEEILALINANDNILENLAKPKTYGIKDVARAFGEQLATMPTATAQIFWADGLVDKSLDTFRSYARLVTGDRLRAEMLTQLYKSSTKNDRINMLYNLDRLWFDTTGATSAPGGLALRDAYLQSRYVNSELASIADYTRDVPEMFNALKEVDDLPPGISQFMHATEGITVLPFDVVLKDIYDSLGGATKATGAKYADSRKYRNLLKKLGYWYQTGSTNNSISRLVNRGFAFLLLFPKLAVKAAVDEATVLSNVSSPEMLLDFLSGKGRQLSRIDAAITGNNAAQGAVKDYFLKKIGKSPTQFMSAAERRSLREMKEVEIEFVDPFTGEIIKQKELITAEEFFGMPPEEMLVRSAIEKYGTKLSDEEKGWLIEYYLSSGDNVADSMINSIVGATFGDSMALETSLAKEVFGMSPLTEALELNARKVLGKPYLDKYNRLKQSEKNLAYYKYFYMLFGKNEKYGVNLPNIFYKNNGLKTEQDLLNFVDDAMEEFGWKFPEPDIARATFLNDTFGQASTLRAAGRTEQEISKAIIVNAAKEMRYVFHAGSGFNEKLWTLLSNKVRDAEKKAIKSTEIQEQKELDRLFANVREPISVAEKKRRAEYLDKITKFSYQVGNLTEDEFYKAIDGFELKGPLKTDIDFPEIAAYDMNRPGFIDRIMLKGYEWMDRQVNDLIRSDVYRLRMLEERKSLVANEQLLVKHLISEGATPENAAVQAAGIMANQASHNAANTILKYVDNPNLKSQLAFNMRVTGRFIRATEDYTKRMMRWIIRHPEAIPYRMGHLAHASSGSGIVYDDQDGNKYVVIPNDGIFWEHIAPAVVMASNLAYSGTVLGKIGADAVLNGVSIKDSPYWGFFKQAEWNQYTMKVSFLNPSYSEGAGMYTFTGPNMALPVIGLRNLLVGPVTKAFDSSEIYNFGLSIDNILLGDVSDNTTVWRSLLPPAVINYFKFLDGEYKDTQGAIAAYQAMGIIQYNEETAWRPEDFLNEAGQYDPSKAQKFLNEVRIQTANVLGQKAAFNSIFGAPLQMGVPDIADYLRKNGTVTMTKAYGDILRGILQWNQENGFPISDPYTVAVSMHAAENPGKLIFQVPKNTNEAKMAINYTRETLSWAVDNRDFVESFPTASWVFAPNIGEYDPKVITFMEAADLIPPIKNSFDNNNEMFKDYLERIAVAKLVSQYYEYDREAERLLNDPNNPNRNFAGYRTEVKANVSAQKQVLLDSNPLLKSVINRQDWENKEDFISNFNELRTIVNEDKYPSKVTDTTKNLLGIMVRRTSDLLLVAEDPTVKSQYMGDTLLSQQYATVYSDLQQMASQNAVLGEAWSAIIKPMLDKVYEIPFRIVRKPGD